MSQCDVKTGVCHEESGSSCHESQGSCSCADPCSKDPIQEAMHCWKDAFCQAKDEVMVDVLKAKIQKAWGPQMDKAADAVIAAMEAKWKSGQAVELAKAELRAKLESIMKQH